MNKKQKKEEINELISVKKHIDKVNEDLFKVIGRNPEGPIQDAIHDLFNRLLVKTAVLVGDDGGWLDWYIFENDMGESEYEAGYDNDMRPICNVDDLLWLIDYPKTSGV
jgi:hypothetical protein